MTMPFSKGNPGDLQQRVADWRQAHPNFRGGGGFFHHFPEQGGGSGWPGSQDWQQRIAAWRAAHPNQPMGDPSQHSPVPNGAWAPEWFAAHPDVPQEPPQPTGNLPPPMPQTPPLPGQPPTNDSPVTGPTPSNGQIAQALLPNTSGGGYQEPQRYPFLSWSAAGGR